MLPIYTRLECDATRDAQTPSLCANHRLRTKRACGPYLIGYTGCTFLIFISMAIDTLSFADIADEYSAIIEWMHDLGIRMTHGRTSHYNRVIQRWKDHYRAATVEEVEAEFAGFVSSMFEIQEFARIYRCLKDVDPALLAPVISKLRRAVNGPIDAIEETPATTTARNFLFEATMMAIGQIPNMGMQSIFDAPSDAGIALWGKNIWIECKRVTSESAIEENVRKASRQLERALSAKYGVGNRGIVALDVSKILNPGDKIYSAKNDRILEDSIRREVLNFVHAYRSVWEDVYLRRDSKIIGTLVRISTMAQSEGRNLLVSSVQQVIDIRNGAKPADVELLTALARGIKCVN